MTGFQFLDYWKQFVHEHDLVGREADVPEPDDLTGVGVGIEILSEDNAREEAEGALPGMAGARDGFVPVGGCSFGTGDPYFINVNDGPGGPLYRISHEDVGENGCGVQTAVGKVLDSYEALLRYVTPDTTPR